MRLRPVKMLAPLMLASGLAAQTQAHLSQIRGVPLSGPNPVLTRRLSDTELSIGWNCSPAQPCQLRLAGGWTAMVDRPWSVKLLGAGEGRARISLGWDGLLYVGVEPASLPISCGGGLPPCFISALVYRVDSYAIAEWRFVGGKWAPGGSILSVPVVGYSIAGSPVPLEPLAPLPGSRCAAPRLALDANRLFVCVGQHWKFAVLSDW